MTDGEKQLDQLEPKLRMARHMIEWVIPRRGVKASAVIEEGVRHMMEVHPGSIEAAFALMAKDVIASVMSCADVARRRGPTSYDGLRKQTLSIRKQIARENGDPIPVRRKRPSKQERQSRKNAIDLAARRKQKYRAYLKSPEWLTRRTLLINERGSQCDNCGAVGPVQVHHLSYERLGRELPFDLQLLCRGCHLLVHGLN